MAPIIKQIIFALTFCIAMNSFANSNPKSTIPSILEELNKETQQIQTHYKIANLKVYHEISQINKSLKLASNLERKVALLIRKDELSEMLKQNALSETSDISKIRYLKGLQIIKILYEKTLSLDHHFASVATFNEINKLSNPNHYPEFANMKDVVKNNQDKRSGFNLSSILGDNIYTSVVHTLVSLFTNSNSSKSEKEQSLKEVECILDFTLRMHNDLNTIYFETAFLQKSNDNIIEELEQLFVDFTKPIKYKVRLKECRNSDDWDIVRENLNEYLEKLNDITSDESQRYKAHKMQINLEFPIDRLMQFLTQYNLHIDQVAKFYEKFGIMLNSYENESQCATKIPPGYITLKANVKTSIETFNTAYKPVEINGSKMKQVLYGINEYD